MSLLTEVFGDKSLEWDLEEAKNRIKKLDAVEALTRKNLLESWAEAANEELTEADIDEVVDMKDPEPESDKEKVEIQKAKEQAEENGGAE